MFIYIKAVFILLAQGFWHERFSCFQRVGPRASHVPITKGIAGTKGSLCFEGILAQRPMCSFYQILTEGSLQKLIDKQTNLEDVLSVDISGVYFHILVLNSSPFIASVFACLCSMCCGLC